MNPINSSSEQFQYLQYFATASGNGADPHASIISAYIFTGRGPTLIANQFTYTKPVPFPSIFDNFTRIPQLMQNTLRTTNLTDLTIELGSHNLFVIYYYALALTRLHTGVGTPNGLR